MSKRSWLLLAALTLAATGLAPGQVAEQHHPPGSTSAYIKALEAPSRDAWQMPDEVMAHLELKPGDAVADIGAGSGYFTVRFARAVGPGGKVYAVDINPEMLSYIEQRATQEHLNNIQTVLAAPDDPKLPPASVDMIFICDTHQHSDNR